MHAIDAMHLGYTLSVLEGYLPLMLMGRFAIVLLGNVTLCYWVIQKQEFINSITQGLVAVKDD